MPRFIAKPITVEAHQFHGTPHDLPLEFAGQLTQDIIGEKAYLPSTLVGGFIEGEPAHSVHDIVYPGDWIVRGAAGFSRMSPGQFHDAFNEVDDHKASPADARWQATYIGADDAPPVQHWLGYRFKVGVPVGVNDPEHAALIGGNAHFHVKDTANDGNGRTTRGARSAEARVVDCARSGDATGHDHVFEGGDRNAGTSGSRDHRSAVIAAGGRGDVYTADAGASGVAGFGDHRSASDGAGRYDNLHAAGIGDAGAAGIEYSDPGSQQAIGAGKRAVGRPRRENA